MDIDTYPNSQRKCRSHFSIIKLLFMLERELQKTTASQNANNWPYQGVKPQLI